MVSVWSKEFTSDYFKLMYQVVLPISKSRKEKFLESVREKVAYYKPRIEEMCGIDLGQVRVKDHKEYYKDAIKHNVERLLSEEKKSGKDPGSLEKFVMVGSSWIFVAAISPILFIKNNLNAGIMSYRWNAVYVPFYDINKLNNGPDFKWALARLDQSVVHELSHGLWDVIVDGKLSDNPNLSKFWAEGFATYCEQVHFKGLYPKDYLVRRNDAPDLYERGKQKVEQLVKRYGQDIVLEIPKRWQEFDQEVDL
jgi:hypothetical protein